MTTCENYLCVYWVKENSTCLLRNTHLDIMGSCLECILVNLPDETLQKARSEHLQSLEEREKTGKKREGTPPAFPYFRSSSFRRASSAPANSFAVAEGFPRRSRRDR